MENKLKIAVIGVGYLGRQHVRIYSETQSVQVLGVVDKNMATAQSVAREFNTQAYTDFSHLLGKVSAVSVAVPTTDHAAVCCELLNRGIDVLVEKPMASSIHEAESMIGAALKHGRVLQVGHLERFNPAIAAARQIVNRPMFFEVHRLGVFTSRSLDIDVVLDLMIHDLDIVLDFVQSPVKSVSAVGLPILSNKIDIANARIEFESGCVANLTASRVSTEKVRKLRFFQPNEYISVDYSRQDVVVLSVQQAAAGSVPVITPRRLETQRVEPLRAEIESFLRSVQSRKPVEVTPESSKQALQLAHWVVQKVSEHAKNLPSSLSVSKGE
jgi:predicted dehydrogenase